MELWYSSSLSTALHERVTESVTERETVLSAIPLSIPSFLSPSYDSSKRTTDHALCANGRWSAQTGITVPIGATLCNKHNARNGRAETPSIPASR